MVDFSTIKEIAIPEGNVKSISSNGTILWKLDEGGLPSEYQEVEYIQSSGTQHIDTGISGNAIGEYEIKLDTLGSRAHQWEQYFAGDAYTESTTGKLYENSNNVVYQGYPFARNQNVSLGSIASRIFEIKVSTTEGVVSNGAFKSSYTGAPWGTLSFWIFHTHGEMQYDIGASMRLYYLKMYSDGVLVRDYIPCYRKSDNVIGLYDLVSQTFFINQGSGSFTKGGDV